MRSYRLLAAAILIAAPVAAGASGGGGSGGGGVPSSTGPAYDPAEDYRKGVAALGAKDYATADRYLGRVAEAAPTDPNIRYLSGTAKLGKGDLKGARKAFERVVKAAPANLSAQRDLAVTLARLGETEAAKARLAELSARAAACGTTCPEASALTEAVAAVQAALGTPAAALDLPAPALADAAAGDRAYLAAVALINEHRYDEAIATLQVARAAFGPHPDVLTYLGYANRKRGDYAAAEAYYRAALRAAPGHRGATEYYGELKVERGDLRGAKAMLASLDAQCTYGCAEAEELRRWVVLGHSPS